MSQAPAAAMLGPDGALTGTAGDAATMLSAAKGSDTPLTLPLLLRLMLDAAGYCAISTPDSACGDLAGAEGACREVGLPTSSCLP